MTLIFLFGKLNEHLNLRFFNLKNRKFSYVNLPREAILNFNKFKIKICNQILLHWGVDGNLNLPQLSSSLPPAGESSHLTGYKNF